jgi:hypothetical protein
MNGMGTNTLLGWRYINANQEALEVFQIEGRNADLGLQSVAKYPESALTANH